MNKKLIAIVASGLALLLIAAGLVAFAWGQNKAEVADKAAAPEVASNQKTTDNSPKDTPAVTSSAGTYITLAEYNADPGRYAEFKRVYFFHASWCPICQGIEKEINADMGRIPDGVVLIKTDYDQNTDLRRKYGITYQYTFVQFDNDGNQIAKWSADGLDKVIAGIK